MFEPKLTPADPLTRMDPNPEVDLQLLADARYDSLTHFGCSYLQHHFNNKLTIVEGTLPTPANSSTTCTPVSPGVRRAVVAWRPCRPVCESP